MQLANCQPLFAWDALEDSPSLGTIKRFLASIPDAPLLDSLRHVHFEACLAELRRNDDLRALIGIPRDEEHKVPDGWNVSRFLQVLGQEPHRGHLHAVFDDMVQRLGAAVPDLGCHTAGDASALNGRRTKKRAGPAATATEPASATATNAAAADAPPPAAAP